MQLELRRATPSCPAHALAQHGVEEFTRRGCELLLIQQYGESSPGRPTETSPTNSAERSSRCNAPLPVTPSAPRHTLMVIALPCPVLSFVPEDLASSMIERGLEQKDEQRADRRGSRTGEAGFILSDALCVCVCGRNRGHFPAEETLVYFVTRETEKSWLEQPVNLDARAAAIFMTSSKRDRPSVGSGSEALPASPVPDGP
ncbi:unnamed protein product [Pleuronectes platessa]|uniref:Uncharacterized protein n=1 Tax=Pleuronectes platessa TaxID=8262 RepID=A0A9N7Z192_PLEPL|nr:unnamed protein product [Pleuronectes platessa]